MRALPEEYVFRMKARLGDSFNSYLESLDKEPETFIRLNISKCTCSPYQAIPMDYAKHAFKILDRPSFNLDPLFHAGCYYVQEAGSMAIEQAFTSFSLPENPIVMDLCAAPGGKSTHLLTMMQGKGVLISNEPVPQRNVVLQQNIFKWGYDNCIITQADATRLEQIGAVSHVVVLDAPCSGEGLFRKDPDAVSHWSAAAVTGCSRRQQELIVAAYQLVKDRGHIIYSTCTFEEEENEKIIEYLLNQNPTDLVVNQNIISIPGVSQLSHGYRFYPHQTLSEGFFISSLFIHNKDAFEPTSKPKEIINDNKLSDIISAFIDIQHYKIISLNDTLFAVNDKVYDVLCQLESIPIKSAGIPIGQYRSGIFKPHPALALNNNLIYRNNIELSREEALRYLAGNSLTNDQQATGLYTVSYLNHKLGWVNAIEARLNNLYPHPWRIQLRH